MILTTPIPEVYVVAMNTFLSDLYDSLEETINNLKSLNININPGVDVANLCVEILVDDERL